ncbi:shikimate kinase [Taibaiella chishuiensis]|uniref:Shikimate kinase n=1 Tax=Taibaiella chishuiensis TaxID=1434707 RepID=A0A2P8CVS8_9BACT|nr:shikimate kinase [Taibaiella chishuiensis]PSK89078.1 shikimate kinase [Taibaiella chishuiensis]
MRLFLTGMPGSGKTYWMQQLAAELQLEQIDLDALIESENAATIPELFARGEPFFRQCEQAALQKAIALSGDRHTLISTGGGLPAYPGNIALMQAAGRIIYLASSVEQLAARVQLNPGTRPLLATGDPKVLKEKLGNLLEQRQVFYEQADIKIEVDNLSLATFAAQIRKYIL